MRHLNLLLLFVSCFVFQGCIQDDIVNDSIKERLLINNPINQIKIGDTYQYNTRYTDNLGNVKNVSVVWSSSNASILSVNNTGEIKAIAKGKATIKAQTETENKEIIFSENIVEVTSDDVDNENPSEKRGTIKTTSSYLLKGSFKIKEIANSNSITIEIENDYEASTSLPGLYLYLTNNPNTINNAKEVSAVSVFKGAHSYTIENVNVNDYSYLLYWCKPFSVKVGEGEISSNN